MRYLKLHHALTLAVVLSLSSANAQQPSKKPLSLQDAEAERISMDLIVHNSAARLVSTTKGTDQYNPNDNTMDLLADTYLKAGRYRLPSKDILRSAIEDMKDGEALAKSTYQSIDMNMRATAKLEALQVAQNGRMIELLEYIAARTK